MDCEGDTDASMADPATNSATTDDGSDMSDGSDEDPEIWEGDSDAEETPQMVVWSEAQALEQMNAQVRETQDMLGLTDSQSKALLRRHRWNREELLMCDMEGLARTAAEICSPPSKPGANSSECPVCFEAQVFCSLNCGHGLCQACWKGTLAARLDGGSGNVFETACPLKPVSKCLQLVPDEVYSKVFATDELLLARFNKLTIGQYISYNKSLVYCPKSSCSALLHVEQSGLLQVECPACDVPFCIRCVSEYQLGPNPPHGPALCSQVGDWNQRMEHLKSDQSARFNRFRMKKCPFCSTQVIKCACDTFLAECGDKDYCPNQACNHMVCENPACGKQYCWICLQPWEGHGSYFNCSRPRVGDAAKNSRFLFCYERYANHANGMEAAAKRRASWLAVAGPAGVPKPTGHWIAKAADLMEKYEVTLMWSYVFCFYLAPKRWAAFRRKQEPLENYVQTLISQIEEAAKDEWHRWLPPNTSIADQTEQATAMFAEIARLDGILIDLRDTVYEEEDIAAVNKIDELSELPEWQLDVDKAMDKPVVATNAAFHYTCPLCEIPNLNMRELFRHIVEEHPQETRAVVCPICADPDANEGAANTSQVGCLAKHMRSNHDYYS